MKPLYSQLQMSRVWKVRRTLPITSFAVHQRVSMSLYSKFGKWRSISNFRTMSNWHNTRSGCWPMYSRLRRNVAEICGRSTVQQQSAPNLVCCRRARTVHLGKGQVQKSHDSRESKLWQNHFTFKNLFCICLTPFRILLRTNMLGWAQTKKK